MIPFQEGLPGNQDFLTTPFKFPLLFCIPETRSTRTDQLCSKIDKILRITQTVLAAAVLITMLGSMASGILLSRYVFTFVDVRGVAMTARSVHMLCAYWGFILMSFHLGLHWSMMTGRLFESPSKIRAWIARIAGAVSAVYGIYAFKKRAVGTYMFLQAHFVFFDYEEPLFLFLLDYLAVMGLFVFLGHYTGKSVKYLNKKIRKK